MNKYKDNMILSKAWPIFKSYAVYFTAAYIMLLGSIISIWITMGGALLFLGQLLYDFIFVVRNVRKNFLLLWLDAKAKRWVLYRIKGETSNIDNWKSDEVPYDVEFVKSSLRYTEVAEKGGFEHFMLKEIFEQPKAVLDSIRGRIDENNIVKIT